MILAEHIEEELNNWPIQWDSSPTPEGLKILVYVKHVWKAVAQEYIEQNRQENCLRALWIIGFELTRDKLMNSQLPKLPVKNRAERIIEEEGPLLFAFYSDDDEKRFCMACRDIELALRRRNLWGELKH